MTFPNGNISDNEKKKTVERRMLRRHKRKGEWTRDRVRNYILESRMGKVKQEAALSYNHIPASGMREETRI